MNKMPHEIYTIDKVHKKVRSHWVDKVIVDNQDLELEKVDDIFLTKDDAKEELRKFLDKEIEEMKNIRQSL